MSLQSIRVTLAAFVFAAILPLAYADDNLVENGDFSHGSAHWEGDGRAPDISDSDPASAGTDATSPASQGLIVKLKHTDWTTVRQSFTAPDVNGLHITVVIKPLADVSFSTKDEDYLNVENRLGLGYWNSVTKVGKCDLLIQVVDAGELYLHYHPCNFNDSSPTGTFEQDVGPVVPKAKKTLSVSFPPGTGTITIQSITITAKPQ